MLAFGVPIRDRAGNQTGAWRMRVNEVCREVADSGWRQSVTIVPVTTSRAPPRYGVPSATNRRRCPSKPGELQQMEPSVDRWRRVLICHSRFSDQNSRYGSFGRSALSGVPTPHPVPCGLNTFSKTQSTPPPISLPHRLLLFPSNIRKAFALSPLRPFSTLR